MLHAEYGACCMLHASPPSPPPRPALLATRLNLRAPALLLTTHSQVRRAADGWEPPSECGKLKKVKRISLDPTEGPEGAEADLRRCKVS